ncbi:MAG: STAS domain-containing protein [Ruminococcus sp.]|nr:STAS domain-containing protein [Ruminococcus sp.]
MTVNKIKENEKLTLKIEGNLGTSTAGDLDAEIKKEIADVKELVFDFEKLDYMASAGLRVLMSTAKTLKKQGGKVKVVNVPKPVMDVFTITGVADVLNITAL